MVICDLDGTLASCKWRLPYVEAKDWRRFYAGIPLDRPNPEVLQFLLDREAVGGKIYYVSGRPEDHRVATLQWLRKHGAPHAALIMRCKGDFRKDHIVKEEILDAHFKNKEIEMVIDDRLSVIEMWERRGLKVWKIVDPGLDPFPETT